MINVSPTTLGDLIEFQRGYDLPKSSFVQGEYPVQSSNGILGYHNEFKVEAPGITIGRSGTVGLPHLLKKNFFPHNTTLFIKDFKGNDVEYIFYLLKYLKLGDKKSGSGVPTMNRNHLHPIKIVAHTNPIDQKAISTILSTLDTKIELNNRINAELEAMAKTLYDYWFVQFDFPANLQDNTLNGAKGGTLSGAEGYKSSGGKMVYNEELKREIPEGWKVKTVGELLLKYTDKSVRIDSKKILKKGKHPVITQDNGDFITGYTNEENPIEDIPLIIFGDHSCTLRYIDFSFFRGADGTQLMYFSQNLTIYTYLFLQKVITQITGYGKYERHFKYLKDFKVIVPKSDYLESFQLKIKPVFDKISHSRFENQQLASLRDWLLPMLMNGQVRVKEAKEKINNFGMAAEPDVEYNNK